MITRANLTVTTLAVGSAALALAPIAAVVVAVAGCASADLPASERAQSQSESLLPTDSTAFSESAGSAGKPAAPEVRCAIDVESQLLARPKLDANVLGFHYDGFPRPTKKKHLQGIHRFDHPEGSFLYLTQDTQTRFCVLPGRIITVRMGSRTNDGSAYGSTRASAKAAPPAADRVVQSGSGAGFRSYCHPGGLAILGDVLAVAMEAPIGGAPKGRIDFYRLLEPTSFQLFERFELDTNAASVGLTRTPEGRYLIAVADHRPRPFGRRFRRVTFYETVGTFLGPGTEFENSGALTEVDLELPRAKYLQNLDLIRECGTGTIYMVAAYRRGSKDRVMRYRLSKLEGVYRAAVVGDGEQTINCSPPSASHVCSLNAAFGVYVGAEGRLLYYATRKAAGKPKKTTELGEFELEPAPGQGGTEPHPACPSARPLCCEESPDGTCRICIVPNESCP